MQFSHVTCTPLGSSQMTEQDAFQSTYLLTGSGDPRGKPASVSLSILARSPEFSRILFSPYLVKLMGFFLFIGMADCSFQGTSSCCILCISHCTRPGMEIIQNSFSVQNLCIFTLVIRSLSLISSQTHPTVPCHTAQYEVLWGGQ